MDKTEELLTRGVENIIPDKDRLRELLNFGKKLNIYLGIDPTATRIHIGHAVPLRKLNQFAQLGHNVTFLIGDFTALIGDTSDKDAERPVLTSQEIKANFETYKEQAEKVLDFSKVQVRFNNEWLEDLSFRDIVKLTQHFSAGEFVSRELIRRRLNEGKKVGLHELLYPVMQGYDSYFMDTDIQLGGTDQTFNMQAGRTLQKDLRNKESFIIANGFLEGTDGRKMSKSWGNGIWLTDEPNDMYGKVMSLKDELIVNYFTLATDTPMEEIQQVKSRLESGENPMEIKKILAHRLICELHSSAAADTAQSHFESTVQKGELPDNIPIAQLTDSRNITTVLTEHNLVSSNSEAKRLFKQNAVTIDGQTITDPNFLLNPKEHHNKIIKVGKRRWLKIINSQ